MNLTQQLRLGIAIARRNYKAYRDLLASPRWLNAFHLGAQPQRLVRASAGTKYAQASDVLYVKALVASDHDDIRRSAELKTKGIHYVDAGTSGGVRGAERVCCLMTGGDETIVRRIDPVFAALAPDIAEAARTPGRAKVGGTAEHGYLHRGPSGAGHFVKMVDNGIEYLIMASCAEGLNILRHADVGKRQRTADAETAPLRHPEQYPYDLNLPDIAEVWGRGSVIASWLLDLTAAALLDSPDLAKFAGRVSDSGEGRWTIAAAIDESVPAPVLSAALYERFSSRGEADFGDKVLSALRYQFGGHEEKAATKAGA